MVIRDGLRRERSIPSVYLLCLPIGVTPAPRGRLVHVTIGYRADSRLVIAALERAVDEFMLDTPRLHTVISAVRQIQQSAPTPEAALAELRPLFAELMADPDWLPGSFRAPDPDSGMGGGIATWLLYRAGDGGLSLFALVVPPGAATPVHDHLAWGLVGLYVGEQREEVYAPRGSAPSDEHAELELVTTQTLRAGDFYELIPPTGDIHRVDTIGAEASVSLHLLGNDTGCVWRHSYDPAAGTRRDFRSGYTNRPCHHPESGAV